MVKFFFPKPTSWTKFEKKKKKKKNINNKGKKEDRGKLLFSYNTTYIILNFFNPNSIYDTKNSISDYNMNS